MLKQWRERLGLHASGVANVLGISRTTWWRWEAGRKPPPRYLLYAIYWLDWITEERKGLAPTGQPWPIYHGHKRY